MTRVLRAQLAPLAPLALPELTVKLALPAKLAPLVRLDPMVLQVRPDLPEPLEQMVVAELWVSSPSSLPSWLWYSEAHPS